MAAIAGVVTLVVAATLFAAVDEDYCADYRSETGAVVSIVREGVVASMAHLVATNWATGRVAMMTPDGNDRFRVAWDGPEGTATTLTFERDAAHGVSRLTIEGPGAERVIAERESNFREEEMLFTSGDAVLAGTLKTPAGAGPFPGVVLVHGSGPGERTQLESIARFFVRNGIAALTYDKRGCGASTGDWKQVDLDVLAGDALVGVAVLRTWDRIDPDRIGLWGISQGGWIAPLAAARSTTVAFVINHSGPGTSLRRQDTYMMSSILRMEGLPQPDIALAVAALNTLYDFGRGKTPADSLDRALDRLRGRDGLESFQDMRPENIVADSLYAHQAIGDPAWFLHLDPDRDALAPYRTLRCPVLVVYGRLDYTVPVEESAAAINATLKAAGHTDYEVKVLDRTGHGFLVMDPDSPARPLQPMSIAPEYFDLLKAWLSSHGF